MGRSKNHPSNRGLVMLTAWIEPALRDYVRLRAREAGVEQSKWIASALRRASAEQSISGLVTPLESSEEVINR